MVGSLVEKVSSLRFTSLFAVIALACAALSRSKGPLGGEGLCGSKPQAFSFQLSHLVPSCGRGPRNRAPYCDRSLSRDLPARGGQVYSGVKHRMTGMKAELQTLRAKTADLQEGSWGI